MFLDIENLSHYLLSRGLVSHDDVVRGSLLIQNAGRRNRNYKVIRGDEPGLFVKQVPVVVEETISSILHEALFYQIASKHDEFAALRPHLLEIHDYDGRIHALTLDLIPDCDSVSQVHMRLNAFPEELARSLGFVLGTAHLAGSRLLASDSQDTDAYPRKIPWLFTVAEQAEAVFGATTSGGTRQLVSLLRQDARMTHALGKIASTWRFISICHGDVKWDNFVVLHGGPLGEPASVRIIDWELSDIGDPGWDVGALLAAYVQHWIAAASPDASKLDNAAMMAQAPHQLQALQPAIRAAWLGYAQTVGLSGALAAFELRRHLQFAGARLALTAFEIAHASPSIGRTVEIFMQLASSVLTDPDQLGAELFGLHGVLDDLAKLTMNTAGLEVAS